MSNCCDQYYQSSIWLCCIGTVLQSAFIYMYLNKDNPFKSFQKLDPCFRKSIYTEMVKSMFSFAASQNNLSNFCQLQSLQCSKGANELCSWEAWSTEVSCKTIGNDAEEYEESFVSYKRADSSLPSSFSVLKINQAGKMIIVTF